MLLFSSTRQVWFEVDLSFLSPYTPPPAPLLPPFLSSRFFILRMIGGGHFICELIQCSKLLLIAEVEFFSFVSLKKSLASVNYLRGVLKSLSNIYQLALTFKSWSDIRRKILFSMRQFLNSVGRIVLKP